MNDSEWAIYLTQQNFSLQVYNVTPVSCIVEQMIDILLFYKT